MRRFDVLVVGAGPAGSAAAMHLARGGAQVLLADRARFPRDKPCGGGITGRALRHAPCDISPVVERIVHTFELRLHCHHSFRRTSTEPLILMTQRRRLDAHLAEHAAAAGATFRDGARVEQLEIGSAGVAARVGGEPVAAGFARRRRRRQRRRRQGSRARGRPRPGRRARGQCRLAASRPRPLRLDRRGRARRSRAGATAGCSRRPTTRISASAAGTEEGPHLRDHLARLSRAYGSTRTRSPTFAATGCRCAASAPRPRLATTSCSSAMRRGSSIRSRATGCTRRSPRPGSPPRPSSPAISRRYPAALAQALDHHAGASWAAKRALDRHPAVCFWAARSPGVFGVVSGLLRGDVGHPNEARGPRPAAAAPRCARRAPRLTTTVSAPA